MNKVILMGRLTADPELRYTQSNTAVCRFNLAVDRFMGDGKENQADFISCTAWSKTAEHVSKYYFKGKKALVEGNVKTGSYDAQDGHKVYTTEVWVERVEFADDKKKDGQQQQQGGQAPQQAAPTTAAPWAPQTEDDDLPFNQGSPAPVNQPQGESVNGATSKAKNNTPPAPWMK